MFARRRRTRYDGRQESRQTAAPPRIPRPRYEALTILAVLLLNATLGFVQEGRAEQALSALRRLSAAHAEVLRGGERRSVPAADLSRRG